MALNRSKIVSFTNNSAQKSSLPSPSFRTASGFPSSLLSSITKHKPSFSFSFFFCSFSSFSSSSSLWQSSPPAGSSGSYNSNNSGDKSDTDLDFSRKPIWKPPLPLSEYHSHTFQWGLRK